MHEGVAPCVSSTTPKRTLTQTAPLPAGDGCRRDKDGYYWLTGRVDDGQQSPLPLQSARAVSPCDMKR